MPRIDLREMELRSNDVLEVYNPDPEAFTFKWDGVYFSVPGCTTNVGFGNGVQHLPRYLARHYALKKLEDMTNKIIAKRMDEEKAKYKKKGIEVTLYQGGIWDRAETNIRTELQQTEAERMAQLVRGVVQKYGGAEPVGEEAERPSRQELSAAELAFDKLTGFEVPMTDAPVEESEPAISDEALSAALAEDE